MKINPINNNYKVIKSTLNNTKFNQSTNNIRFATKPLQQDTISFSGNKKSTKNLNINYTDAKLVAEALSRSTSGYRAEYNTDQFNKNLVEILTVGVADYIIKNAERNGEKPTIMIGGDTRKASVKMLPFIAEVLSSKGIDVIKSDRAIPTPVFAQIAKNKNIPISILMTASHNPWTDGGYNLLTNEGAIAPPSITEHIAKHILEAAEKGSYEIKDKKEQGKIKVIDFYPEYLKSIDDLEDIDIDWRNIKNSNIKIYYDPLKGAGANVFPRLLEDKGIKNLHLVDSGKKLGPNPTENNLIELSEKVKKDNSDLVVGLSNDGDADRFGVIDENGKFISPNDVLLLAAYHLHKNKKLNGAIIKSQATSGILEQFAKENGLNILQTPVGFKYIGETILNERNSGRDILVAGEESGGLTVTGHIPEKDGILALSLILDLIATEKKPISKILKEIKLNMNAKINIQTRDMKYKKGEKEIVMNKIEKIYNDSIYNNKPFEELPEGFSLDIEKTKANEQTMRSFKENGDGFKFYMTDGSSILIRKSGTEDKIKGYAEILTNKEYPKDKIVEKSNKLISVIEKLIAPPSQN